jgi:hypothetical protein
MRTSRLHRACCVLTMAQDVTRSNLPKGGNQKVALDSMGELLRKSATFGRAGAPPTSTCVETESAVDAIAQRLTCEPLRRKERTRQALTGLVASGVLTCREGSRISQTSGFGKCRSTRTSRARYGECGETGNGKANFRMPRHSAWGNGSRAPANAKNRPRCAKCGGTWRARR